MRIKRILCPTDLTADSETALRYGVALARAYEAQFIQMYCQDSANGNSEAVPMKPAEIMEQALLKHADRDELIKRGWRSVVSGCDDAGECITREAAKAGVDLIVMRSRRRPHRAALLGSTAESVCRTAPCPVMVMHSDARDWINGTGREIGLKRVLVAYDFSDYSELALKLGLLIAQEYQAELHLLHVLPPFSLNETEISWYPIGKEGVYHKAARRLQKVVPDEAHLWCTIKNVISEGQPYREILNYSQRNEIDLVCIGAHGAGFGIQTLFGSNVDRVLRQAPCPVLVARPLKLPKETSNILIERTAGRNSETGASAIAAAPAP